MGAHLSQEREQQERLQQQEQEKQHRRVAGAGSVRYVVRATLRDVSDLDQYLRWLQGGHVADVVRLGGAFSGCVVVLERDAAAGEAQAVESIYEFPNRAALDAYLTGPALQLREEGKRLWMDTGKVTFSRSIGAVTFVMQ
jgi:hypothetical protein